MDKKNRPWWKDPRFIIPSILVPVGLAVLGLVPSLLPDNISNELTVTMTLTDPRRPEAGAIEAKLEHRFMIDDKSESQMANEIAKTVVSGILAERPALNPERKKIPVTIDHASDGTISIDKPDNNEMLLHLGRFVDFKDLDALMSDLEAKASANQMEQKPLTEPVLPTFSSDITAMERAVRAGVYRIIVSAPGYTAHSIYVQLSNLGKLFTLSESSTAVELNFPVSFDLYPKFSPDLKIAIRPCRTSFPIASKPKFAVIDKAIREEMVTVFRQNNFVPILVDEKQKVGFDLNPSKGLPATEGLISADLLIENCRCEWLE
jgi:hypothetical protein